MDRQTMGCEARSWRDVGCHVAHQVEPRFAGLRKQGDDQILQRDHANLKLHQFGIRQRWGIGLRFARSRIRVPAVGPCAALAIPPGKGESQPRAAIPGVEVAIRPHGWCRPHSLAATIPHAAGNPATLAKMCGLKPSAQTA